MKLLPVAMSAMLCGCAAPQPPRTAPGHGGSIAIVVQDQIGASFRLQEWKLAVDGKPVASCSAAGMLAGPIPPIVAYEGYLPAGEHTLTIAFRHRGHGEGVFAYLKGYSFRSASAHTFEIGPEGFLTVDVSAFESGGPTTPLERRPSVRFEHSTAPPDALMPRTCQTARPQESP